MEVLLQYLDSIHPLSDHLKLYLSEHLKVKELQKKDFLLKAGHYCRQMYFVDYGLLRCYYHEGDAEVCSWFMKDRDVITSIQSFFRQVQSHEYIQALEDCKLYYIDNDELQFIYNNFSEFNFISRVLITNYYVLWDQILNGIRMQQAHERYSWLLENHSELILRVPAKFLASFLRIGESHLSVIKSRK